MSKKFSINVVQESSVSSIGKIEKKQPKEYFLEDAIRLTEHGRFHTMIVIVSGLVMMGSAVENMSVAVILPNANCDLHLSTIEFVIFGSIPFLGIVMGSHLWGLLADTWGRRNVIRLTATFAFITSITSTILTNIIIMIILRFLVGFFAAGLLASVFSYVSEFHTKEKAPTAAAIVSTFMPIIFLYASLMAIYIIPMNWSLEFFFITFAPWRLFMMSVSLINLVNAIAFCFLPETPKFLMEMNRADETIAVLKKMYSINTGLPENTYPVESLINESVGNKMAAAKGFVNIMKIVWNQTKPIFVKPYLDSTIKLCYMVFVLFAIGHGTFIWFPDFVVQIQMESNYNKNLCAAVSHKNISSTDTGDCNVDNQNTTTFKIILVIGLIYTTLSGVISFYLNKIGPRILVPIWLTISAVCSIGLVFLTEFYSILFAFITFMSASLCAAIIGAISVNLYPTKIRAMATCFIFMCGRIGGLVGSNLIGVFLEDSCSSIFYAFSALTLSCVVVFLLIKKQTPQENNKNDVVP